MTRLGAILALFGFGSAVLHFTDVQFRLLFWAEKWQPALGLVAGAAGALFLLIATLRDKDGPAAPPHAYGPPPGAPAPQGAYGQPPAGYGPPPGGFAQPPAGVPGGYGQPAGGYPPPGPPIPQQGPPYGQRPPQGPPQQRGPAPDFGPRGR